MDHTMGGLTFRNEARGGVLNGTPSYTDGVGIVPTEKDKRQYLRYGALRTGH